MGPSSKFGEWRVLVPPIDRSLNFETIIEKPFKMDCIQTMTTNQSLIISERSSPRSPWHLPVLVLRLSKLGCIHQRRLAITFAILGCANVLRVLSDEPLLLVKPVDEMRRKANDNAADAFPWAVGRLRDIVPDQDRSYLGPCPYRRYDRLLCTSRVPQQSRVDRPPSRECKKRRFPTNESTSDLAAHYNGVTETVIQSYKRLHRQGSKDNG